MTLHKRWDILGEMTDMRSEYARSLVSIGEQNSSIVVLGADTTDSLKTSEFGKRFPDRFFNVGIAEANLVSISAGLAASGKTPFASTYAIFLPGRAVDQIRNNVAYPCPNGRKGLNVKLVVSHGGLSVGPDGGSHQQIEDIAIMRAIPHMQVMIPSDTISVAALTRMMAEQYGPFYMRMARPKTSLVHDTSQQFESGKGIVLRDGTDCTIVSCGITVPLALEAAEILSRDQISCRVIDMFCIKPIDNRLLERAARETGYVVTSEEHNIFGGLGSAVAESISETYPVPVYRIGVQDTFGESARDDEISLLLGKHGITSLNIVNQVKRIREKI